MKKILLPLAMLAIVALPATADAAGQCRNSSTGKFAKCGTPGAVPAAQYVAKGKTKAKAAAKPAMTAAKPAMAATAAKPAAAKPSLMSRMKMKPKPAAAAAPAA